MRWLFRARQGGKTQHIIHWFTKDPENRVILTHSEGAARDLRRQIEQKFPATSVGCIDEGEWQNILRRNITGPYANTLAGRKVTVAVDNLEHVLSTLVGAPVEMVTATGPDECSFIDN